MRRTYTYNSVPGLRKALREVPREAQGELRDAAQDIAGIIATKATARARSVGGVAKYVAPTIRAKRDRIPVVQMGGSGSLPSGGIVGDVWGGAEFGSRRYRQFAPFTKGGRFLYPTISDESEAIMDAYGDALIRAIDKAAR